MKAAVPLPTEVEAKKHCTKLTLNVFARVEKEEKYSQATLKTVPHTPTATSGSVLSPSS